MHFVLGADFILAIILVLLLRRRPASLQADRWLILALSVLAVTALGLFVNTGPAQPAIWLMPLAIFVGSTAFLVPPVALYLYVREATGRFAAADLLWFLPAALSFFWLLAEAWFGAGLVFEQGFAGVVRRQSGLGAQAMAPLSVLVSLVFPLLGLHELKLYRDGLRQQVAAIEGFDLSWAEAVLWSVIAGGLLGAVLVGLGVNRVWIDQSTAFTTIMILFGVQLGAAGFFGLGQRAGPPPVVTASSEPEADTDEAARDDFARLRDIMDAQSLHLEDNVNLQRLADAMDWDAMRVSRALRGGGMNFFDFINGYRVEQAKVLLEDPAFARVSILVLGLDAGFQSKASFNRIFKAKTGEAPTAYRKRLEMVRRGKESLHPAGTAD